MPIEKVINVDEVEEKTKSEFDDSNFDRILGVIIRMRLMLTLREVWCKKTHGQRECCFFPKKGKIKRCPD